MITEIWQSFRRLPVWVQIWVALILVPANLFSLVFAAGGEGRLIAALAIGGMAPNVLIMWKERGLSRAMSLPHLVIWVPLVGLLAYWLVSDALQGGLMAYAACLLVVNGISLCFDVRDGWQWFQGERAIA